MSMLNYEVKTSSGKLKVSLYHNPESTVSVKRALQNGVSLVAEILKVKPESVTLVGIEGR